VSTGGPALAGRPREGTARADTAGGAPGRLGWAGLLERGAGATASGLRRASCGRARAFARITALAVLFASPAGPAGGHGLEPALLALRETSPGVFDVVWKSAAQRLPGADVRPVLPADCRQVSPIEVEDGGDRVRLRWSVDCGPAGLDGREVGVADLDVAKITALVRVEPLDRPAFQGVLNEAQPAWAIPARASAFAAATSFLRLGVRHAVSGADHVLLLASLLLLATDARGTIPLLAAFLLGEALALAPAALGAPVLPAPPASLLVAVCLLGLATILARREASLLAGAPRAARLTALATGLVQGAGFAGALGSSGLPATGAPVEWLGFQAGLLAGQSAVVAALLGLRLGFGVPIARRPFARRAAIRALGALAAFWLLERLAPWLG